MATINRRQLIHRSGSLVTTGTAITGQVTFLNFGFHHGYVYGNTGNLATATLKLVSTGLSGAGAISARKRHGVHIVHIQRENALDITMQSFANASNTITLSLSALGAQFTVSYTVAATDTDSVLVEMTGTITDMTP